MDIYISETYYVTCVILSELVALAGKYCDL